MSSQLSEHQLPKGLSQPAIRALLSANIRTVEDVSKYSTNELLKLHGFGPKAIRILQQSLDAEGLHFVSSNIFEEKDC
ncbi:DNA-directed RNA polymerase subunit alpha C-terminal domain-containing protein [Paenibacillus endoradicis]|uniref:DNA-directed RNA polymerase subunit alpha C-terminal domain-containing protein n=1 Tax=Paenibacillus endoradicis TaxID=2972487 RepID=UPI0021590AD0|nr:DNA-directed RNA polymerase subunit alpha C-terminal domain-containing protein [Paenibacillus endoradicis]MCR8656434.1 helix-hairpin-helix domain-containing protein [Paenibacillus endoradicis]